MAQEPQQQQPSSTSRAMDRIKAAKASVGRTASLLKPSRDDFRLKGLITMKPTERRSALKPPSTTTNDDDDDDEEDNNNNNNNRNNNRNVAALRRTSRRVSIMEEERDGGGGGGEQKPTEDAEGTTNEEQQLDLLEVIPDEYKKHQQDTEPMLHYLRKVNEEEKLSTLMMAAQQDVRLHQARIKASIKNDVSLLKDYSFQKDQQLQERLARKEARKLQFQKLQQDANVILQELEEDKKTLLTSTERIQVKLARWQRALELYVYCPTKINLDLLGLLEKLMDGTHEVCTCLYMCEQTSCVM